MRTLTKTYEVFKYNELSEEAKERVKEKYIELQEPSIFTEICEEKLVELFPNSDLKIQYSLNYCQGDGLNIYGQIYLDEVFKYIRTKFTDKEQKFFKWAFNRYGSSFELQYNQKYCYCICSMCHDFSEDILENMEYENMKNIPINTLLKFDMEVGRNLDGLCAELEEAGYSYFYEVSENELQEWADVNNYEFFKDGKVVA